MEAQIRQKARELGIAQCGIIKADAMLDYGERLRERMARIPQGEGLYRRFMGFADPRRAFPWAKSVVVTACFYGHYHIPAALLPHYGKYYLVDMRLNPASPEAKKVWAFEAYLHELGLRTATEEQYGLTALRWAAFKAGLGYIRRNNFFYTEKGSWFGLNAWIIDKELELIETHHVRECPLHCSCCIRSCPTKSLFAPYTMNMATCISRLSTSNEALPYTDEVNRMMGTWLYGCDVCQNACPMNQGTWEDRDRFPNLEEAAFRLMPEQILSMDYGDIRRLLSGKFFYIQGESLWRWKLNAINAMVNGFQDAYIPYLHKAKEDRFTIVQEKARWALHTIAQMEPGAPAEAGGEP
ncbi:MAG: epoxyqueuosine reductase [Treponema sp.]|jgi:epoxyqueuosine reductase|nr:epoxyqueuosine reductase [Treponema sp.]